jgi:hydrogenase maturation protease
MKNLVLGLGNLLLADEGVGVHVAQQLLSGQRIDDLVVLDVGNAVLDAMPAIAAADKVIVVDAMKGGGAPGTVYRVAIDDCVNAGPIGSVHGFDLKAVLHLMGRLEPPEVVVIGVEPDVIGWSLELSAAVTDALPAVVTSVRGELLS